MLWDPLSAWPAARRPLWVVLALWVCAMQGPDFIQHLRPAADEGVDFFQEWASARNYFQDLPIYTSHHISRALYLGHQSDQPETMLVEVNVHPPASVLLALPFAALNYVDAVLAWNVLSLVALAISLQLTARALNVPVSGWSLCPLVTLLLICMPFRAQMGQGQLNLVLLLLLTGVWLADRADRPAWSGIWLGLAGAIKLFPAFLLLYFILQRRWRTVVAALTTGVVVNALAAALFGVEAFRSYATEALPRAAWFRAAWNNASLAGFWCKLFDPAPEKLRDWCRIDPLSDQPMLARIGWLLSCAAITLLVCYAVRRAHSRPQQDRALALAITAMLLVSPITWEHYFLLLLLPLTLVWQDLPAAPLTRALFLSLLMLLWSSPASWYNAWIPGGFPWGIAQPVHALTVLAIPCYALLGLFAFQWTLQPRPTEPNEPALSIPSA